MSQTPLRLPIATENLAPQSALWRKMDSACTVPLTILHAPAGYGKTTTVASWIEHQQKLAAAECAIVWFALDALYDDLFTFCTQLLTLVRSKLPGVGSAVLQLLASNLNIAPDYVGQAFVRDVAKAKNRLLLILDDYHVITSPTIHSFVATAVTHSPTLLSTVITTSAALPFSVERLRSQKHLLELDVTDLQLSLEQSQRLLIRLCPFLSREEAALLLHRYATGWGAGIQLLALALGCQPNHVQFIDHFVAVTGEMTISEITAYLAEQVLIMQPVPVREFLLYTSLLSELDAPACAAMLPPALAEQTGELLDKVIGNGLFVTVCGAIPGRLSYNDLFRDLLVEHLHRTCPPATLAALYRRVAAHYVQTGRLERGLERLLTYGCVVEAVHLLEEHTRYLRNAGKWRSLHSDLQRLPEEARENSPLLMLAQAWVYQFYRAAQLLDSTLRKLAQAIARSQTIETAPALLTQTQTEVRLLETSTLLAPRVASECEERVLTALTTLPMTGYFERSSAHDFLARCYQRHGEFAKVVALFDAALLNAPADASSYKISLLYAYSSVALLQDELDVAMTAALRCHELAELSGHLAGLAASLSLLTLTCYAYGDRDDLAIWHGRMLLENPYLSNIEQLQLAVFCTTHLLVKSGDLSAARQVVRKFATVAVALATAEMATTVQILGAVLEVYAGNPQPVAVWLRAFDPSTLSVARPYAALVWAEGVLLLNDPMLLQRASTELAAFLKQLQAIHLLGWAIEIQMLLARLYAAQGRLAEAMPIFTAALAQGVATHHWGCFLRGDRWLETLAAATLQGSSPNIRTLLSGQGTLHDHATSRTVGEQATPRTDAASPSLTEREYEILRCLVHHETNREVAAHLNISVHTARNHTRNIYTKLGVHRRSELLERARALGLI